MNKLQRVLEIVNKLEDSRKGWFSRGSNNSMFIVLRDPRCWGGNPNREHWANARAVEEQLHEITMQISSIEIDQHAGNLVIEVYNIYKDVA